MKCCFAKSRSQNARLALAGLIVPALVVCCSRATKPSTPDTSGGGTGDGDVTGNGEPSHVELANKMNYTFHSSLSAVTTPVQSNGDITFDWSTATVDMLGREMDPLADIDVMQLMLWRYTKDEFLAGINKDELDIGRLVGMGYCDAQHLRTNCHFFDLVGPGGSPIPQDNLLGYVNPKTYSPNDHVWVIMLATGKVFGRGTRLLAFVRPTDGESNDQVRLSNDSTTLSYTVDLAKLDPILLPQHVGEVVLSWDDKRRLTMNGMGAAWIPTYITDVAVARYVGYSVADLERHFLLLQELASEQYDVQLDAGQEVALSRLSDQAGNPFPGIDENGVWLFSLTCGSCRNPAPWFVSILRPTK
jgi:hypothetical protein